MIPIWTCYSTDIGVLYDAWTMCGRCEQPQGPQQDTQLHMLHSLVIEGFYAEKGHFMPIRNTVMVQFQ